MNNPSSDAVSLGYLLTTREGVDTQGKYAAQARILTNDNHMCTVVACHLQVILARGHWDSFLVSVISLHCAPALAPNNITIYFLSFFP